ncbi:hypothetical protein K458DRAFT_80561 [Lentithecium fluviatile CBS 122367]|uniref:Uncharacterized protein n=1 Tax=Lentithecium fluviatile CBS 122367 TaxID=1168545 RepID=A0A6G1IT56_9PLEO|nr:hypothetical protein K458DRAFT_80561 [Lentithecium fluviatile CBS 122367]
MPCWFSAARRKTHPVCPARVAHACLSLFRSKQALAAGINIRRNFCAKQRSGTRDAVIVSFRIGRQGERETSARGGYTRGPRVKHASRQSRRSPAHRSNVNIATRTADKGKPLSFNHNALPVQFNSRSSTLQSTLPTSCMHTSFLRSSCTQEPHSHCQPCSPHQVYIPVPARNRTCQFPLTTSRARPQAQAHKDDNPEQLIRPSSRDERLPHTQLDPLAKPLYRRLTRYAAPISSPRPANHRVACFKTWPCHRRKQRAKLCLPCVPE